MAAAKKITGSKLWLPLVIIILVAINWAAAVWHSRIDFTNEKRFTLSTATKNILKNIKGPVQVDVFMKGNYPSGFKKLAATTSDLLQEFREVSGTNFQFNFISPNEKLEGTDISYADSLNNLGLPYINLTSQVEEGQQQQVVFPIAFVHFGENVIPVVLFEKKSFASPDFKDGNRITSEELNRAEAMLEFKFAEAISKVTQQSLPTIGYSIGNGEPQPGQYISYDLIENILRPNYNLFTFNLNTQSFVPKEFNLLIIVKPTETFTEQAKLKLDQYVMNGGKVLMFIDRLNAEMDSLQIKNEVVAFDRNLQLNDLLFKYGARINTDLIMDLQCDVLPFDVNGQSQFELLPWNYFPVITTPNNGHSISKNLTVSSRFVNSIDTVEAEGVKKTILLSSSSNSRKIASPALISGKENSIAPQDEKFKLSAIPMAVLLEGKFTSLYANRATQAMSDSIRSYGGTFLAKNINNNKMIIVADGDIVLNSVVKGDQPIPMGMNPYTYGTQRQFPFANKDFVKNCIDYLIDNNGLSEAKGKDYVIRLLNSQKVKEEKNFWQIINIAVPVLLVILFAVLFQWNRKRKYSK